MKAYIFNDIFGDFKFIVCFAPLWHEVDRNIILDLGSTDESVKSKRGSGDIPTRRAWLCVHPHRSVVGAASSHDLGSLASYQIGHANHAHTITGYVRVNKVVAVSLVARATEFSSSEFENWEMLENLQETSALSLFRLYIASNTK